MEDHRAERVGCEDGQHTHADRHWPGALKQTHGPSHNPSGGCARTLCHSLKSSGLCTVKSWQPAETKTAKGLSWQVLLLHHMLWWLPWSQNGLVRSVAMLYNLAGATQRRPPTSLTRGPPTPHGAFRRLRMHPAGTPGHLPPNLEMGSGLPGGFDLMVNLHSKPLYL